MERITTIEDFVRDTYADGCSDAKMPRVMELIDAHVVALQSKLDSYDEKEMSWPEYSANMWWMLPEDLQDKVDKFVIQALDPVDGSDEDVPDEFEAGVTG